MGFVRRIGAGLPLYLNDGPQTALIDPTYDPAINQLLEQTVNTLFYSNVSRQGFAGREAFIHIQQLTTDHSLSASMKLFDKITSIEWDMVESFDSFELDLLLLLMIFLNLN